MIDAKAEKDLPIILKHAKRMQLLAGRVTDKGFKYKDSDDYAFMLISFFMKQQDHLKSVCVLVEFGQHRDATAIARMMLEGLCTLPLFQKSVRLIGGHIHWFQLGIQCKTKRKMVTRSIKRQKINL